MTLADAPSSQGHVPGTARGRISRCGRSLGEPRSGSRTTRPDGLSGHTVLWRRTSFGSQSESGAETVARLLKDRPIVPKGHTFQPLLPFSTPPSLKSRNIAHKFCAQTVLGALGATLRPYFAQQTGVVTPGVGLRRTRRSFARDRPEPLRTLQLRHFRTSRSSALSLREKR